jgi:hypothetical protein
MIHDMARQKKIFAEDSNFHESPNGITYAVLKVTAEVGVSCFMIYVPGATPLKRPFSPDSGEKVADRPDEGAVKDGSVHA